MPEKDEELAIRQSVDDLIALLGHSGFKIMQARLDADRLNSLEELSTVHPENTPEIMRLQQIVARSDYYRETVIELIRQGQTDEDLIEIVDKIEDDGEETDDPTGA